MVSIVLAGGNSLRLGRSKAMEKAGGQTLLQWVIDSLTLLDSEILVVIAPGQPPPRCLREEVRIAVDLYPGKAALGGIYTGLAVSNSFHNLVVACDMPFLNLALLRYLIQLSADFDAVVPQIGGKIEPLHAIYSKNCLAPIEQQIKQGQLKVRGFLDKVKVRYVDDQKIAQLDPQYLSFFNVNTLADLKRARALLKGHKTNPSN